MVHTKESIQELLRTSDRAVVRALNAVFALQTVGEQAGHSTKEVNGVGFSRFDAPFLTDMVVAVRRWGSLTPKQMAVTRNKILRYHRQLVQIANAQAQHVDSPPESVPPATVSADESVQRLRSICQCEYIDGEGLCGWCEHRQSKAEFSRQEAEQETAAYLNKQALSDSIAGTW